ncbi:MAG: hypothetical protein QNI84_08265 [Henriciella sp.]|nr:hypothetical protein [Henriciella sp.]
MRITSALLAFALLVGCASNQVYGPAASSNAVGYSDQVIENNRYRIKYKDSDIERARVRALKRAAEITDQTGAEWFQIVSAYDDVPGAYRENQPSVTIGGSTGSSGRTSVGVGLGIGFPVGSSRAPAGTHSLEIITGSGEAPEGEDIYIARDVLANLAEV